MNITKNKDGAKLTVELEGRLDTTTSPELEKALNGELDDVTSLVFDFKKLVYISSAGLRVMLANQKVMSKKGEMVIENVCADIMEVFEMTGFTDILTIK